MQARRIFRRWPTDRYWTDLPGAHYQEWLTFYLELPVAREAIQKLLGECQARVWYSLASFRATLKGDNPYVMRPGQRYVGEAGFKLAEDLREQWEHTDGEIVAGMFRSTLYELGLVALGYRGDAVPSRNVVSNPDMFMVTDLGYEVMHSDLSASQQPSAECIVVQPNFQVLLMEPYMPAMYSLIRFASLDQIGRVSRFTLTREALTRGLQQGVTIEHVVEFLQRHSQKSLPQNVIYTLRDWARQAHEAAQPSHTYCRCRRRTSPVNWSHRRSCAPSSFARLVRVQSSFRPKPVCANCGVRWNVWDTPRCLVGWKTSSRLPVRSNRADAVALRHQR